VLLSPPKGYKIVPAITSEFTGKVEVRSVVRTALPARPAAVSLPRVGHSDVYPEGPRRTKLRRKSTQNGSASLWPIATPETSRHPSAFTPITTITSILLMSMGGLWCKGLSSCGGLPIDIRSVAQCPSNNRLELLKLLLMKEIIAAPG
jgi:hypothetical protein